MARLANTLLVPALKECPVIKERDTIYDTMR